MRIPFTSFAGDLPCEVPTLLAPQISCRFQSLWRQHGDSIDDG